MRHWSVSHGHPKGFLMLINSCAWFYASEPKVLAGLHSPNIRLELNLQYLSEKEDNCIPTVHISVDWGKVMKQRNICVHFLLEFFF